MKVLGLVLTLLILKLSVAHAIPETGYPLPGYPETSYQAAFQAHVMPFFKAGETYRFKAAGGLLLAGIKFVHPNNGSTPASTIARKTIVVLPGRSEPYAKYAEVFYDLYSLGFDIYSYDHRGQGLSPHLSSRNEQIGDVDDFTNYVDDLETFTRDVVQPDSRGSLYLLAHSMGGGIAARYLSEAGEASSYTAAVLSAPMLDIITKPYPRPIAKLIVGAATKVGLGARYAPGRTDLNVDLPFDQNQVTHSEARFWMSNEISREYPDTKIGGPSNRWVYESLVESPRTVRYMKGMVTPTVLLQATEDELVKLKPQDRGCGRAKNCRVEVIEGSMHEILQEKDFLRDHAFRVIFDHFMAN